MAFNSTYKTLFELKFRHRYFLDEGKKKFKENLNKDWMKTNLRAFNVSDFLSITPTQKTQRLLKNWRGKYLLNSDNLSVLLRVDNSNSNAPFIEFSDELVLDFLISLKDPYFENYTKITIDRTKLMMISNQEPSPAVVEEEEEDIEEGEFEESFEENTVYTVQYSPLSDYGNIASEDIDVDFDQDIEKRELVGKIGLIRIHLQGDEDELTLTDGTGLLFPNSVPKETLLFKNRKTCWKYIDAQDGSPIFDTGTDQQDLLPHTKYGYIKVEHGGNEYPNPTPNQIINVGGTYSSEIFI